MTLGGPQDHLHRVAKIIFKEQDGDKAGGELKVLAYLRASI